MTRNSLKTSIALDASTLALLDAHGDDRSRVVRTLLAWYAAIVERERPAFTEVEWTSVREACRELAAQVTATPIATLTAALPAVAPECVGLGFAARVAVLDDAVRWWRDAGNKNMGKWPWFVVQRCDPVNDEWEDVSFPFATEVEARTWAVERGFDVPGESRIRRSHGGGSNADGPIIDWPSSVSGSRRDGGE